MTKVETNTPEKPITRVETQTPEKPMTKKVFQEVPEVENFYKLVHKYNLREEVYKAVLQCYIRVKSTRIKS